MSELGSLTSSTNSMLLFHRIPCFLARGPPPRIKELRNENFFRLSYISVRGTCGATLEYSGVPVRQQVADRASDRPGDMVERVFRAVHFGCVLVGRHDVPVVPVDALDSLERQVSNETEKGAPPQQTYLAARLVALDALHATGGSRQGPATVDRREDNDVGVAVVRHEGNQCSFRVSSASRLQEAEPSRVIARRGS